MANTVIGLFDNNTEAQSAVQELRSMGMSESAIDVSTGNDLSATDSATSSTATNTGGGGIGDSISNFFSSLFEGDEVNNYDTVARRSSTIVTVHTESAEQARTAAEVLDRNGAIDVDERAAQYRTATSGTSAEMTANTETTARAEGDISIPVVEEDLQVGKRTVETGGARIRSRVIERPVEENLRLRSEHVVVERHAVNRAATDADFNRVREGEFEVTEHAEVAVVSKEARVVEEVSIGKTVEEHTETVRDTVRRTDVEVEEVDTDIETRARTADNG